MCGLFLSSATLHNRYVIVIKICPGMANGGREIALSQQDGSRIRESDDRSGGNLTLEEMSQKQS
jgi:hypothetical protein